MSGSNIWWTISGIVVFILLGSITASKNLNSTSSSNATVAGNSSLKVALNSEPYSELTVLSAKVDLVIKNLRLQTEQMEELSNLIWNLPKPGAEADALENNVTSRSCANASPPIGENEVYEIYLPKSGLKPFEVPCIIDPHNGTSWTVIMRREDNSTNFYRNWHDYKNGFGNLNGEFFIGLDKLHAITSTDEPQELWVLLEDFEGKSRYAKYQTFAIGDENSNYLLRVLGEYSGTGGDALRVHHGMQFTTKDSDNDVSKRSNCAVLYKGAWWYEDCHNSNLNGPYLPADGEKGKGIIWFTWHTHNSLRYAHMAVRPVDKTKC